MSQNRSTAVKSQPRNWTTTQPTDLETTIAAFKAEFPGWWYSVCECGVSCDASAAPTVASSDIFRIVRDERFNNGFHADLQQPSSLAAALQDIMAQARSARINDNAVLERMV